MNIRLLEFIITGRFRFWLSRQEGHPKISLRMFSECSQFGGVELLEMLSDRLYSQIIWHITGVVAMNSLPLELDNLEPQSLLG